MGEDYIQKRNTLSQILKVKTTKPEYRLEKEQRS